MSWPSSQNGTEAEELEYQELSALGDDAISAITYESDTDKMIMKKKKKSSKPPRSPSSPYLSSTNLNPRKAPVWRSLKGTGQMHTESPMMKVPRQLWLASLKQGNGLTQPLKSDMDIGQAWVSPGSSTPEYLKEALGMKKPKYSRSASNGYIPGTPDFKEKEDMYDQILDLKKMLQAQKSEADLMKTKLRRLEEENSRKDRQIEQLLDPSRSSEFARSLVDKRSDSSLMVNNLKQKILKLEKQCKEKENALSKLQTELKTTSLEEMRIAMETYYEEIQRLQMLLTKAEAAQQRPLPESKDSLRRQKALNAAVLNLSKQVKELQEENRSLKTDLDRTMAQSPATTRSKGYSEWSKQRLVRKISELEKKLESTQKSTTEQSKSTNVTGTPTTGQGEDPPDQKPDPQEECERLKNLVKKIKEDRGYLQERLGSREADFKKLQQEKSELEKQLQELKDRKDEREEINRLNQKMKRLEAELEDEKHEKEAALEAAKKAKKEPHGSRPSSARSASSGQGSKSSISGGEKKRKQEAAQLIQKNWRMFKSRKEENNDLEETMVFLQAALRGHLARRQMLPPAAAPRTRTLGSSSLTQQQDRSISDIKGLQDTSKEDDPLTFLQSAFRAHLSRTQMLGQRHKEMKGRESPIRTSPGSRKSSGDSLQHSLASENRGEISEDNMEEESKTKSPNSQTSASRRSPSDKSHPPLEDPHSDDSDDIIVVSPARPARRKDSNF